MRLAAALLLLMACKHTEPVPVVPPAPPVPPPAPVVQGFQCNWEDTMALRWARELVDSGYHLETWWYDSTGRAWTATDVNQAGCLAGYENTDLMTLRRGVRRAIPPRHKEH